MLNNCVVVAKEEGIKMLDSSSKAMFFFRCEIIIIVYFLFLHTTLSWDITISQTLLTCWCQIASSKAEILKHEPKGVRVFHYWVKVSCCRRINATKFTAI